MKVGVISDTHDRMDKISRAVERFRREGVECIIHCGDFVAPFSLVPFQKLGVRFISVFGNNDGEKVGLRKIIGTFGEVHSPPIVVELAGKTVVVSHSPIDDFEIERSHRNTNFVFHGHTHKAVARKLNDTLILDPGEACGWLTQNATIAIVDMASGGYEFIEI
jgi:putative phosphoesterase